ncbi:phage baseplate plug family protein [Achromobacter xylosoxidans]|uniref:phage baseplate plug family protein n=1 Tax=Alcaligenes xylosoxydans xylosoxydans TaxID=85698 RepID=UPI0038FC7835
MRKIPLRAVPAQTCCVVLGGQNCQVSVYQKSTGVYLDLQVNHEPVAMAVLCHDRVWLIRETYSGFVGDLTFVDTQGRDDPVYKGFGGRFQLMYRESTHL